MSRIKELVVEVSNQEFAAFIERIKELSKITNTCKLRLVDDEFMLYSIVAEQNKISKMKTYFMPTADLFQNFSYDGPLQYIILEAKNWVKQFSFLLSNKDDITMTFRMDQSGDVFTLTASNSELELNAVAGDMVTMKDENIISAPLNTIKSKVSTSAGIFSIEVDTEKMEKIRRLSKLETEDLITVSVDNGVLTFGQSKWKLKFDNEIDIADNYWTFHRENIECITKPKDTNVIFAFFNSFIVVDEGESKFMYVLELQA